MSRTDERNARDIVSPARTPSVTCPVVAGDSEPLVCASELTKRFGSFVAVDDIDFQVTRGEAFGFLGPDGAGKSSTIARSLISEPELLLVDEPTTGS